MTVEIRAETPGDRDAVYAVNAAAFPTEAEARLVDRLRETARPIVSLVALSGERVTGHILFSPVALDAHDDLHLMGLGPMAVLPEAQRGGIGTSLVRAGLERCRDAGAGAVCVLGHPEFYPRFGFEPSCRRGIASEYDVPEEVFMLAELTPGYLDGYGGVIRYDPAFAGL